MFIELRRISRKPGCGRTRRWNGSRSEPELLAAKAVALGRNGDLQEALAFSDASIEERGDTPYVWLARGDVLLARRGTAGGLLLRQSAVAGPAGLVRRLAGGADPALITSNSRWP